MTKLLRLVIAMLVAVTLQQTAVSQSLSVNTDGSTAHPSALLDVKSTVKGLLVPRMSKADKNLIGSPATGLLIFQDTPDSIGFYYYTGTKWAWLDTAGVNANKGWLTIGNAGTDSIVNFLGTLDDKPLMLRQNNLWMGQLNTKQRNYFIGGGAGRNTVSGLGNNAYGDSALYNVTTGGYNTAIGNRSMLGSAAITGSVNVAVGNNSLSSLTTGSQNVGIGDYAMASMKTGGTNVVIGPGAMETATKGSGNIGLGLWALRTNDSASYNIAIGESSLYYNDSARNIAIGYQALVFNNRNDNMAIGFQSGYYNNYLQTGTTQGIENTYLGFGTGVYANTGSQNVSLGYRALQGQGTFGSDQPNNVFYKRNVAIGDSSMTFSYGSDNVAVGYKTLSKSTSTSQHVAVGSRALQNTTAGYPNTAIGYISQDSATSAFANTSVGSYSLSYNKQGYNNTAIGNAAMYQAVNTTTPVNLQNNTAVGNDALRLARNFDNTAIGASTLSSDTSGYYNTAVGYVSMNKNLSGVGNSALGVSSLRNNLTGNYNIALGTNALYNHKSNDLNTAVGYQSMFTDTSGSANVAMGWNSLYASRGSQQNVAIGTGALEADSTGSYNTAVGRSAAFHADSADLITAMGYSALTYNNRDYNTAVGAYAGYVNAYNSTIKTQGAENTLVGYATMTGNALGSQNVAMGFKAGAIGEPGSVSSTAPSRNVAIGDSAMQQNRGDDNVGIGYRALSKNTTGQNRSVAIGSRALLNAISGYPNIAIGYSSQDSLSTGQANTSLGTFALMSNKIGSNNTAIGNAAMMEAYSPAGSAYPFDNTAIGNDALRFTRYYGHVAVGAGALRNDTSGTYNTAVGYLAMYENRKGSLNTAVGTSALRFDTSGWVNTAVGVNALYNHRNGDNNVAVGYDALVNDIDGGANTALGTYAMFSHKTNGVNTAVGQESMYYDTAGSYNTALGWRSLRYTKNGFENVALGVGAIEYSDSSYYNTAVGRYAMFGIGGTENTAIGYRASGSATGLPTTNYYVKRVTTIGAYAGYKNTAAENTFVGYASGQGGGLPTDSLRGIENTGLGTFTLTNTSTGKSNTALGMGTLFNNTTGSGNVAIGTRALANAATYSYNIAIGDSAMYGNNASGNMAIGTFAMRLNNTGAYNTGVGNYSLLNNTTGSRNVSLGDSALYSNISGSTNTGIGYLANTSASNLANATAIGANAFVAQSNSMVLGSINTVNGATATTSVGIGTNTPAARLHVRTGGASGGTFIGNPSLIIEDNTQSYVQLSNPTATENGILSGSAVSTIRSGMVFRADSSVQLRSGGNVTTMTLDNDNLVGIGTTVPTQKLHVIAPTAIRNAGMFESSNLTSHFSNGATVYANNTYAATNVDVAAVKGTVLATNRGYGVGGYFQGGYVGLWATVDNTNPGTGLRSTWGVYSGTSQTTTGTNYGVYGYASSGATNYGLYCSGNGAYTGTWTLVSDGMFKKDVKTIDNSALGLIQKLNPVSYLLKKDEYKNMNFPSGTQYGFVAQELEKVFPILVENGTHPAENKADPDLKFKAVNYIGLIPVLTKAMQEQQQLIINQQKQIDDLLLRVSKLENK